MLPYALIPLLLGMSVALGNSDYPDILITSSAFVPYDEGDGQCCKFGEFCSSNNLCFSIYAGVVSVVSRQKHYCCLKIR